MKTKFKNNQGITLIALIITVIILVILVAVSINAVANMGIVGHAVNGSQEYLAKSVEENTAMRSAGNLIENTVEKINNIQAEEIKYTVTITFQNSSGTSKWQSTKIIEGEDNSGVVIGSIDGPNGTIVVETKSNDLFIECDARV